MNKQKINKVIKYIGWKALGALVFVSVAGTSIWALAAFTEPTAGPSSSVQDFAKNIMGANNSDNDFDSSSVTANSDGSIVERLEDLESKASITAISAEAPSTYSLASAATYCRNLSATAEYTIDGSDTSTTYTNWRLGSIEELGVFVGVTTSTHRIWSTSAGVQYAGQWTSVNMDSGSSVYHRINSTAEYVRCVR